MKWISLFASGPLKPCRSSIIRKVDRVNMQAVASPMPVHEISSQSTGRDISVFEVARTKKECTESPCLSHMAKLI